MTRTNAQRETSGGRRLLLAVAASVVVLLALGAGSAAAAPAAIDRATGTCWKDVVNDWLQHEPNVVGTYPIPCYTQAIQHLNQYTDVQQYWNAEEDIHRALLAAIQDNRGDGGGSGGSSSNLGGGGPAGSSGGPSGPSSGSGTSVQSPDKGFVTRLFDSVGPGNAESVPLPLLVLAGLAVLLLLAAAGTWLAKRLQARRMTPAPAPARGQRGSVRRPL
jgi:hypothetical protein